MKETFLNKRICDRCEGDLSIRILSWVNEDVLCNNCKSIEQELIAQCEKKGEKIFEGMGITFKKLQELASSS